jgi:hypothetical protein
LFYSPGSVAGDGATGYKELTGLSQPLPAGKYWVGTVTQNVTTTAPKMYGSNSACFPAPQSGNGNTASSTMLTGWQGTNIGNAPVGAFTVAGIIQQNPKVVIKAA